MLKNMEEFKAIPFVSNLGVGRPSGKKFRLFVQNLNAFLKESEFREKFGFEKNKYSVKDGISLLMEIYPKVYNNLSQKPKLSIKDIEKIPETMLNAFALEGGSGTLRKIKTSIVKLGGFHNNRMIGFIAASFFQEGNVLNVEGVYTIQQYREYGLAAQFIYGVIKKAKRMNLAGVNVDEMTWASKYLMEKLKKRLEAAKLPIMIKLFEDEDYGFCAEIRFTGAKKN